MADAGSGAKVAVKAGTSVGVGVGVDIDVAASGPSRTAGVSANIQVGDGVAGSFVTTVGVAVGHGRELAYTRYPPPQSTKKNATAAGISQGHPMVPRLRCGRSGFISSWSARS